MLSAVLTYSFNNAIIVRVMYEFIQMRLLRELDRHLFHLLKVCFEWSHNITLFVHVNRASLLKYRRRRKKSLLMMLISLAKAREPELYFARSSWQLLLATAKCMDDIGPWLIRLDTHTTIAYESRKNARPLHGRY